MTTPNRPNQPHEKEFDGPIYKHPYFLYAIITAVLAVFLLLVGTLAYNSGLIPTR